MEGMKLGSVNWESPQRVEEMGSECDRNILYICMKVTKNKFKILYWNKVKQNFPFFKPSLNLREFWH